MSKQSYQTHTRLIIGFKSKEFMKTSPKSWVLGNSHGPFDTSKRLWCLDEMCNFTGTGKSESGTNHLDPLCKAAVPTLSTWEAGDQPWFHCAASTIDTFIHIHIHYQQRGVPVTQRTWQGDFKSAKSAPTELLGSSVGRLEMSSATQASSCHHGCFWWFFPSSAPTAVESKHWTAKPCVYIPEDLVNIWLCFCLDVILVTTERILAWHQII